MSTRSTGQTRKWLIFGSAIVCFWLSFWDPGFADSECVNEVSPQSEQIKLNSTGQKAFDIKVRKVESKRFYPEVLVPGRVEIPPNRNFKIHSLQEGRICRVFVTLGQAVKQGQVLAWLDSAEVNQLAAQALQGRAEIQADLAQTKTVLDDEVTQAESRHKLAKANHERVQKLFDEKICARKELDHSISELEIATTKLAAAQKKQEQVLVALNDKLRLTIEPLRQRLSLLGMSEFGIEEILKTKKTVVCVPIRSSHDGAVVAINTSLGQSVSPADSLFMVADMRRVWVTAQIYESDVSEIHEGQEAVVKLPSLAGRTFQGRVSYVSTSVDPVGRTLPVAVELANEDGNLKLGMYAEVHVRARASRSLPIVPWEAIVQRGKDNYVFVESAGTLRPVQVRLGDSFDNQVEITGGLQAGDRIVTDGAFQLEGALVSSGAKTATVGNDPVEATVDKFTGIISTSWWQQIEVLIGIFVSGFLAGLLFLSICWKSKKSTSSVTTDVSSQRNTSTFRAGATSGGTTSESKV